MFRVLYWAQLFQTTKINMFGLGPGNVGIIDNMYVKLLFSTGYSGVVCFLMFSGSILFYNKIPKRVTNAYNYLSNLWALARSIVILYLVCFITGDYLDSTPGDLYFWTILGGTLSIILFGMKGTKVQHQAPNDQLNCTV
jgi:hypothetical protein